MRKIHLLISLAIPFLGIFLSCKKQKSNDQENGQGTDTVIVSNKILLPFKFSSEAYSLTLEYEPATSKLAKIIHSDKSYMLITYAANYYRVERFKNNTVYHYDDFLLTEGRATKIHSFDSFGRVDTPTGHSTLEYNASGQLVNIKEYDASKILIMDRLMSYAVGGNLSKLTTTDKFYKTTIFDYTSDNKNGIFKHLKHARELFLAIPYSFFCPDGNNPLSCRNALEPQQNIRYNYVYNAQNYPSQIIIDGPEGKRTFDITYAEVTN